MLAASYALCLPLGPTTPAFAVSPLKCCSIVYCIYLPPCPLPHSAKAPLCVPSPGKARARACPFGPLPLFCPLLLHNLTQSRYLKICLKTQVCMYKQPNRAQLPQAAAQLAALFC